MPVTTENDKVVRPNNTCVAIACSWSLSCLSLHILLSRA